MPLQADEGLYEHLMDAVYRGQAAVLDRLAPPILIGPMAFNTAPRETTELVAQSGKQDQRADAFLRES